MANELNQDLYQSNICTESLAAIEDAFYVLGGKWKLRIVVGIMSGYRRFNELQRVLNGISARVLSNELKELETNGIIFRKVDAQATPVIVTYLPTNYADTIRPVILSLANWGKAHRDKIKADITDDRKNKVSS
jgi:DNA-binding HxlR family transcriptional regulator